MKTFSFFPDRFKLEFNTNRCLIKLLIKRGGGVGATI